jgi:hypothetical protein
LLGNPCSGSMASMTPRHLARIVKLAKLRSEGALSEAEFEAQKAKILAEADGSQPETASRPSVDSAPVRRHPPLRDLLIVGVAVAMCCPLSCLFFGVVGKLLNIGSSVLPTVPVTMGTHAESHPTERTDPTQEQADRIMTRGKMDGFPHPGMSKAEVIRIMGRPPDVRKAFRKARIVYGPNGPVGDLYDIGDRCWIWQGASHSLEVWLDSSGCTNYVGAMYVTRDFADDQIRVMPDDNDP